MHKITVCGAFRLSSKPKGGQEIKTWIVANELEKRFGKVKRIDTLEKYSRYKIIFQLIGAAFSSKNLIILPAQKGLVVESVILRLLSFLPCHVHYIVIGGWLQDKLQQKPLIRSCVKSFDHIYVETDVMLEELRKQGLRNVTLMRNCKPLKILTPSEKDAQPHLPLRLVTFSRVTKKKGIETAVDVVNAINEESKKNIFQLDIYGSIDKEDEPWFYALSKKLNSDIHYKGNAPFDKSTQILKDYDALLFPTEYFTEGVPGTIIDAYAAGLPVISSKWKSFSNVVIDGKTGLGYTFGDNDALKSLLNTIARAPKILTGMRDACLNFAKEFLPSKALTVLFKNIAK